MPSALPVQGSDRLSLDPPTNCGRSSSGRNSARGVLPGESGRGGLAARLGCGVWVTFLGFGAGGGWPRRAVGGAVTGFGLVRLPERVVGGRWLRTGSSTRARGAIL